MRTGQYDFDADERGEGGQAIADWKASPETVLEDIDRLLEPFGLEVVMLDTGGDSYGFRVEAKPQVRGGGDG